MTFSAEQKALLGAKLDASHVKSRSQAGRSLSYIEGWHAIAEANRIFGFDMWHRETVEMRQLGEPREVDGKWRVGYMAKVRVEVIAGDRAIIREGCGYGSGIDRDVGSAHESALKEAETDAMKRALMTFGNPFGLALYDKEQNNVETPDPRRNEAMAKATEWANITRTELGKAKTVGDIMELMNSEDAGRKMKWLYENARNIYDDMRVSQEKAAARITKAAA